MEMKLPGMEITGISSKHRSVTCENRKNVESEQNFGLFCSVLMIIDNEVLMCRCWEGWEAVQGCQDQEMGDIHQGNMRVLNY